MFFPGLWLTTQMKRLLILILSISLSGLSVAQAVPGKIGAPCTKIDSLTHVSGVTLICATSGKKLLWKKFQASQPAKTAPAPQTPSAPTSAPQTPSAPTSAPIDPMVQAAYTTFDHKSCAGQQSNFNVTYFVAPDYSPEMLAKQKALYSQAMACYNGYFDKKIDIAIAIGNQNDSSFLLSQTLSGKPLLDSTFSRWVPDNAVKIAATGNGNGPRGAGAAGWNISLNSAWVVVIDSTFNSSPDAHAASHEFVHILQSYSRAKLFDRYDQADRSADYVNMASWFWEGTAELFSYDSINPTAKGFDASMLEARYQAKETPSLNKITTNDEVVATLQKLQEPAYQDGNLMNYALGSVICEYTLATYGYAKYWQLMKNAGVYKDFNENLKATLGLGLNELFVNAAPFILSQWKLNNF